MIGMANFFIISDGLILVLEFLVPHTMTIHTKHWHGLIILIVTKSSSVFLNFEDLTFLEFHVWFVILMLVADLMLEMFDMAFLIKCQASHDEDAEDAEARFFNDSLGD